MNTDRDKGLKERVRAILSESVSVLCRTMLQFDAELSIRGLLGITLDNKEVFLVDILETVHGRNHDVSDVAVIDPGKDDSEVDTLVVDDSDAEDGNRASGDRPLEKRARRTINPEGTLKADLGNQQKLGEHLQQTAFSVRSSVGINPGGVEKSLTHLQHLATSTIVKAVESGARLAKISDGTAAGMANNTNVVAQAINTTHNDKIHELQSSTEDHSPDVDFRLRVSERPHIITHKGETNNKDDQQSASMYTLCACETTGNATDCTMRLSNTAPATLWHPGSSGGGGSSGNDPAQPRPPDFRGGMVTVTSLSQPVPAPASLDNCNPANMTSPVLASQDPYQLWNKTCPSTTTSTWQPAPTVAISSSQTTTWAGPTRSENETSQHQPHQPPHTSNQPHPGPSTSNDSLATPLQNLYSSLPETISSAILHTTYTQGNTPKHLRGEGVFPCKLCSRVFTYKKSKARHMKRHLGEFFTCDVCKKTFCRKDVLMRHQHNVHGVKMEGGQEVKSPHRNTSAEEPTMSLMPQSGEVPVNSYTQGPHQPPLPPRTFETHDFTAPSPAHLTVPRPQMTVVSSIPQSLQPFLTLSHSAMSTHPASGQTVGTSLSHGASP